MILNPRNNCEDDDNYALSVPLPDEDHDDQSESEEMYEEAEGEHETAYVPTYDQAHETEHI